MSATVDELTITYTEDGVETVKELDKKVLTKGAWATLVYQYQDWNKAEQAYGPIKFRVVRYQKRNGKYLPKSKFNISSVDQAQKLMAILNEWIDQAETDS